MRQYGIDVNGIPEERKEWGSIKSVFEAAGIGAGSTLSLGYIVYNEPHYSGVHEDNEVIYIIEGEGKALIGEKEIEFRKNYLLVIPVGTEHSIAKITAGPVKAILAHFT